MFFSPFLLGVIVGFLDIRTILKSAGQSGKGLPNRFQLT